MASDETGKSKFLGQRPEDAPPTLREVLHARSPGDSGKPRWMEPFAKQDMFGRPTVFSVGFDPFKRPF